MTQRAPGRKSALIALTAVASLALGALAPIASAQVSTSQIPGTGAVDNAVGSATGTVDQVSSGAVGGTTDAAAGTVDTATGNTDSGGSGGSTTGNVVQNVGNVIDKTVDETTDAGNNIYEGTKKTVDNTTSETGTAVNSAVNSLGDSVRDMGGNVTNPLLNARDPRSRDRKGDGNVSPRERNFAPGAGNKKSKYGGELAAERASRKLADRGKIGSLAADKNRTSVAAMPGEVAVPERETFITQLAQAAGEAAEKLAFPLGLALMVGAFLMLQGRIDRKDAKLVLAPIDSEQDLLSFQ